MPLLHLLLLLHVVGAVGVRVALRSAPPTTITGRSSHCLFLSLTCRLHSTFRSLGPRLRHPHVMHGITGQNGGQMSYAPNQTAARCSLVQGAESLAGDPDRGARSRNPSPLFSSAPLGQEKCRSPAQLPSCPTGAFVAANAHCLTWRWPHSHTFHHQCANVGAQTCGVEHLTCNITRLLKLVPAAARSLTGQYPDRRRRCGLASPSASNFELPATLSSSFDAVARPDLSFRVVTQDLCQ